MGRRLLEKMGWKDGMSLGKSNEGCLEPLILDIKTDRKGLMSQEEGPKRSMPVVSQSQVSVKDLSGKHPGEERGRRMKPISFIDVPRRLQYAGDEGRHWVYLNKTYLLVVSAIMELAVRRKWGPPQWELVEMTGPHHSKTFMFKGW